MIEYIKTFLIGGGIVTGAKLVSTLVDPAYAGLVAGMPLGIVSSFFMKDDKVRRRFYTGYMKTDIVTAIAVSVISLLLTRMPNISVDKVSAIGYFIWAICSFLVITYFEKPLSASSGK